MRTHDPVTAVKQPIVLAIIVGGNTVNRRVTGVANTNDAGGCDNRAIGGRWMRGYNMMRHLVNRERVVLNITGGAAVISVMQRHGRRIQMVRRVGGRRNDGMVMVQCAVVCGGADQVMMAGGVVMVLRGGGKWRRSGGD